jgi:hypothetical protein
MDTTCLRSNQGELVRYESHYAQIKGHRDIYTIPRVTTLHRYIDGTVKRTRPAAHSQFSPSRPHKGSARGRAPFGTPRAAQYDSRRKSHLQEPDRTLR